MKITDKRGNLIAIYQKSSEIKKAKNFLTNQSQEFQFGTFHLEAGEEIERHMHNEQSRSIKGTSEAIVVIEGSLEIEFFDEEKEFIKKIIMSENDSLLILSGGHGIKILKECKFVEFKQGPYIEDIDKEHF